MESRLAFSVGCLSFKANSISAVSYSGLTKREPKVGDIDRGRMEKALAGPRKLIPAGLSREELREYLLKDSSQT